MEIFNPPDVRPKRPPGRQPKHSPEYRMMVAKKVVEEGMSYRVNSKRIKRVMRAYSLCIATPLNVETCGDDRLLESTARVEIYYRANGQGKGMNLKLCSPKKDFSLFCDVDKAQSLGNQVNEISARLNLSVSCRP